MNDLRDTRKHVGATITDQHGIKAHYAMAASEAVHQLLSGNPGVELATLRFRVDAEYPPRVTVTGRVGSLVGPDCQPTATLEHVMTCCNQLEGRPHTEYCRGEPDHATHDTACGCAACKADPYVDPAGPAAEHVPHPMEHMDFTTHPTTSCSPVYCGRPLG